MKRNLKTKLLNTLTPVLIVVAAGCAGREMYLARAAHAAPTPIPAGWTVETGETDDSTAPMLSPRVVIAERSAPHHVLDESDLLTPGRLILRETGLN